MTELVLACPCRQGQAEQGTEGVRGRHAVADRAAQRVCGRR
ncbi:hypothetical protein [Streptomyces sp. NPDC094149]